jgi:hypothetical protein
LKASLMSTSAQTSCRWVAAARAANSTLVRPDDAGPQTSVRHPRGSPPVSVSISRTPLETICGVGRTSNRDAGATPESLGIVDRRLKTSVGHAEAATATGRPKAAVESSGTDDMEDLRISGNVRARHRLYSEYSLFIRLLIVLLGGGGCQVYKTNCRSLRANVRKK